MYSKMTKDMVRCRFPTVTKVHVAKNVCFLGTDYIVGMLVCCGSTAGLPDFAEVLQIMLICEKLTFVVCKMHGTLSTFGARS